MVMAGGDGASCLITFFLLQADSQTKILASLREAVLQRLHFLLSVSCNCCVVSKQHVSGEGFADLRLGFKEGEVE